MPDGLVPSPERVVRVGEAEEGSTPSSGSRRGGRGRGPPRRTARPRRTGPSCLGEIREVVVRAKSRRRLVVLEGDRRARVRTSARLSLVRLSENRIRLFVFRAIGEDLRQVERLGDLERSFDPLHRPLASRRRRRRNRPSWAASGARSASGSSSARTRSKARSIDSSASWTPPCVPDRARRAGRTRGRPDASRPATRRARSRVRKCSAALDVHRTPPSVPGALVELSGRRWGRRVSSIARSA